MPNDAMSFNFDDAPGGDIPLDELFSSEPVASATNENKPSEPVIEQTESQAFLKTSTGTTYKTADDAVKGIEHKDALIAQLRQELEAKTGNDPLKKHQTQESVPVSYLENPKQYFDDIKKAKSEDELIRVQKKFVDEQLMPYAPLIASMAKTKAVEEVASDVPEITVFLRSDDYRQTLDKYPLLKQSVQIAESNPQVAGDLGQLYRMAYTLSAGARLPQVVQQVASQRVESPVRPTASSTPPPAPSVSTVTPPSLNSSTGRKSLMQDMESKGVLDLRF